MAIDCPLGKFICLLKQIRNIKIPDPVITMNSFYDLQTQSEDTIHKVRFAGTSVQPPWLANRN